MLDAMLGRPRVVAAALSIAAGVATFFASPTAPFDGPRVAEARVSIAYTLPLLVDGSPWSVVATPLERKSAWEQVDGSRKIVTYTKVRIERRVYGSALADTVWVRHLGGAVGRIGQQVAGEAVLPLHQPALLFLHRVKDGRYAVSGAAQGHFRLLPAAGMTAGPTAGPTPAGQLEGQALESYRRELTTRRVALDRSMGKLVRRAGPVLTVQEVLKDKTLAEAIATIQKAKAARDAENDSSR